MLVELAGKLRAAGLPVTLDRLAAYAEALDTAGVAHAYWVGRLTLCGSPEDIARYDAALAPPPSAARGPSWQVRRLPERSLLRSTVPPSAAADDRDPALSVQAADAEVLRHRDIATLSDAERAEAAALLARIATADITRPGRRHRPAGHGDVDRRRSVRAMLRAGGEPRPLLHRVRAPRPRRLVLLIDVSGSMSPYADALLRLAHAFTRHRPRWTETYSLGTRLTRLTPALRIRDVEAALREAGRHIPDWRGGTRLADGVAAFVRRDGHRGVARRAAVVVFSDGWESADPARLGATVAHLRRLAARTVWVSPHAGRPGFAPTAGGLAAVLPHVDALVAGHTVAALHAVLEEVRRA
ncbi:VWA domain-containing protein [Dactylosporangium aurantiacum]|uniref:VWA domain-containing protein n=1 Tax=Dactylosporangium aurantiacum TaxID=35754 RepID=A0A9Q9MH91_9ACTN|nr:VWA domain-containing protein [Dactylosporangium aurantiacum]MDG6109016.1 VWA domain-containing protein [Dactylosporangium aurantiacum]UWZ56484.1 VWA domain-containing protein [Dactylosporangium aurantiacum]